MWIPSAHGVSTVMGYPQHAFFVDSHPIGASQCFRYAYDVFKEGNAAIRLIGIVR